MKEIIIDGHNDTMMHLIDEKTWLPIGHIGEKNDLHIDLHKLEKGGLNAPIFAAFTEGYYNEGAKSLSRSLALLNCLQYSERENQENFQIVKRLVDIKNIIKEGKIAGISAIEGAYFFQEDNYYELNDRSAEGGVIWNKYHWNILTGTDSDVYKFIFNEMFENYMIQALQYILREISGYNV